MSIDSECHYKMDLEKLSTRQHIDDLHIFSDPQNELLTLSTSEPSKIITELTLQTRRNLQKHEEKGTCTIATRVYGHAEIQENDLADLIRMPKSQPLKLHSFLRIKSPSHSLSEVKAAINKHTLHLWHKSWTNNNTGHHLYDLQPMISRKAYKSLYGRKAECKVNRLKMGDSFQKQHLHRIVVIDNPTCECGTDHETPENSIFHCQNNAVHRDILIDTIELYFVASQTPILDKVINLKTILGYNSHLQLSIHSSVALSPASKHKTPANHTHRDLHCALNLEK